MSPTLAGVGDLVVMRPLEHVRKRPSGSLLDVLDGADLVVGNLEVPLTATSDPQKEGGFVLRAEPELLADVAAAGVGAVSLANNHACDQGWPALSELAQRCLASGVVPLGVGRTVDEAFTPVIHEVDGLRIGFVTATCVSMERFLAARGRPGMAGVRCTTEYVPDLVRSGWEPGYPARPVTTARAEDVARLTAAGRSASARADLVVGVMHWGVSHQPAVCDYQRALARALVDAGAGVIFGCHAHVLQAVEVIERTPVFYGLSSLFFGYQGAGADAFPRDSAVALVEVGDDHRVSAARLVLGRLDASGEPLHAEPARAELLMEMLRRYSAGWGTHLELSGNTLDIAL